MTKEETITHNEKVQKEIQSTNEEIEALEKKRDGLATTLKAPCEFCPYDGVYRCEACREFHYALFNIKDWTGEFK